MGFDAQKKELEGEHQKQVDDMFFFGYQCYMKKNNITQDIPSYSSDDKDPSAKGPTQGNRVPSTTNPSSRQ